MAKDDPILPLVYITQYALTSGVTTLRDVKRCDSISSHMISTRSTFNITHHKPNWHESKADAIAQVKVMAASKRRSLEKSLAKLDAAAVKAIEQINAVKVG